MAVEVIAEDDRDIRELVELILDEDGYTTMSASDGLGALNACRAKRPDVVLLDVSLPGELTGLEVCRRIRADEDLHTVRVMLLTARAREQGVRLSARDAIHRQWSVVASDITRSRSARVGQAAAEHSAQLAHDRYQAGTTTQLELLQAQRDAFSAQVNRIQADADLVNARVQLRLAAGQPYLK